MQLPRTSYLTDTKCSVRLARLFCVWACPCLKRPSVRAFYQGSSAERLLSDIDYLPQRAIIFKGSNILRKYSKLRMLCPQRDSQANLAAISTRYEHAWTPYEKQTYASPFNPGSREPLVGLASIQKEPESRLLAQLLNHLTNRVSTALPGQCNPCVILWS